MDYINLYVEYLSKFFKIDRPLQVIFDCSNGSVGPILSQLLKTQHGSWRTKLETTLINDMSDGNFPAHGPNPMASGAMDELIITVKHKKADLGVIFDADGDRVFFVSDVGMAIDPDIATYLLAEKFKPPYVIDINTGWLMNKRNEEGEQLIIQSRVGPIFMKEAMRGNKASFGAERSGHYYFKDFFYLDSGILAAIHMMNLISQSELISKVIDRLPRYYRVPEMNFKLPAENGAGKTKDLKLQILKLIEETYRDKATKISHLDGLSMEFGGSSSLVGELGQNHDKSRFWFNLRPSNTEPLLRLNMEAESKEVLDREFKKIEYLIKDF